MKAAAICKSAQHRRSDEEEEVHNVHAERCIDKTERQEMILHTWNEKPHGTLHPLQHPPSQKVEVRKKGL